MKVSSCKLPILMIIMPALVIFAILFPVVCMAEELLLGIIDESKCNKPDERSVRVLFINKEKDWKALDNSKYAPKVDLKSVKWTIAFDGKNIGKITSIDPNPSKSYKNPWHYKRDKLFQIVEKDNIPSIKNKTKQFGGWCSMPENRPLVLVSKPNFADPEQWVPFKPDISYKEKLFIPLKLTIGRFGAYKCVGSSSFDTEPYDFKANELILYKSFKSIKGRELVSIGIDQKKTDCDGPPPPEWTGNWFLLDGDKIEYIGREMTLVDAGDYDNDGISDIVFWYSGYNKDGYILIYNNFKQKVEYLWGYH